MIKISCQDKPKCFMAVPVNSLFLEIMHKSYKVSVWFEMKTWIT